MLIEILRHYIIVQFLKLINFYQLLKFVEIIKICVQELPSEGK